MKFPEYLNSQVIGIYKIINLITNDIYIGSSFNIYHRVRRHYSDLKKLQHHNCILQNSFNKYGHESFKSEILEICTKDQLVEKEVFWITLLNPKYNITKDIIRNNLSKESRLKGAETYKERYKKGEIKCYKQQHAWVKVYQYTLNKEFIKEYDNIANAARDNNIKVKNLSECVRLPNRSIAGGFIWSRTKL